VDYTKIVHSNRSSYTSFMMREELPPTVLVIFGITGDLSRRYILPALEELGEANEFPPHFKIIGTSRSPLSLSKAFGGRKSLEKRGEVYQMDFSSDAQYNALKKKLVSLKKDYKKNPQYIFYFAMPPEAVPPVIDSMGRAGMNGDNVKLLLEKPFGTDLVSAKELIARAKGYFTDSQIYRIDHYLAKEMAQNLIIFLGSNMLFRDVWNNKYIEKIDIVVAERIGIEGRVGFYEQSGALRDIVQSHLMQLAALVLMEPRSELFDFSDVPKHRLAAIKSLKVKNIKDTVRAQYRGYSEEVGNPDSMVETFVSLELGSDNPRWRGVPITLTTGKRLDKRLTVIDVYFKKDKTPQSNKLTLRIQPNEGVELDLLVKEPGYSRKLQKRPLSFSYGQHFSKLPQAYEQILLDAIASNQSLFASGQEVLASWEILQPVLEHWKSSKYDLRLYKPGSTIAEVLS
jgi:glucose-6-phosphate 1-dehydrogenase